MASHCTFKGCGVPIKNTKNLYCPIHEGAMLRQMARDGYLQELPEATPKRRACEREDTGATKRGVDDR